MQETTLFNCGAADLSGGLGRAYDFKFEPDAAEMLARRAADTLILSIIGKEQLAVKYLKRFDEYIDHQDADDCICANF